MRGATEAGLRTLAAGGLSSHPGSVAEHETDRGCPVPQPDRLKAGGDRGLELVLIRSMNLPEVPQIEPETDPVG